VKVVILAGGIGTRLSEETDVRPKPMVEIGGKPLLWHIMKIYAHHGFNDFIVCLGYKGYIIKEYFHHYFLHQSDVTIDLQHNTVEYHNSNAEPWRITMVDTGLNTMTGGRIKRIREYVGSHTFMVTYGDGVGDIDVAALLRYHNQRGKVVTVTAVQPSGRFGALEIDEKDNVHSFIEKPEGDKAWINGGFFVMQSDIFRYLKADETILEREPLQRLAAEGQFAGFKHRGYWQAMDTLREKNMLEEIWKSGRAPWKTW
jgi:glucose-1-phosphate cytidylyltransferase